MDTPCRLEELRRSRHVTRDELARKVGVRAETVERIERGTYVPTIVLARRMADALGTTLDELFGSGPTHAG